MECHHHDIPLTSHDTPTSLSYAHDTHVTLPLRLTLDAPYTVHDECKASLNTWIHYTKIGLGIRLVRLNRFD